MNASPKMMRLNHIFLLLSRWVRVGFLESFLPPFRDSFPRYWIALHHYNILF